MLLNKYICSNKREFFEIEENFAIKIIKTCKYIIGNDFVPYMIDIFKPFIKEHLDEHIIDQINKINNTKNITNSERQTRINNMINRSSNNSKKGGPCYICGI